MAKGMEPTFSTIAPPSGSGQGVSIVESRLNHGGDMSYKGGRSGGGYGKKKNGKKTKAGY
jgi:hypothetical protein